MSSSVESMDMNLESLKKLLFRNAMRGKWEEVVRKYSTDIRARDAIITKSGDTVLHIAVCDGQETVVERLVKVISHDKHNGKKVLQIENGRSITPLHIAATIGSVKMCYDIASVDPSLVSIRNSDGETPLFLAARHGNKDSFLCLHSFCSSNRDQAYLNCRRSKDGETILHCAIMGDFFDLAFHIIYLYKELVNWVNVHGFSPLHLLATKPSAFRSGNQLGRWKMIIYHCIFVDKLKVEPNSFSRNLLSAKLPLPQQQNCYPENYESCAKSFDILWKGIQVVSSVAITKEKPNNDEASDGTNADPEQKENPYIKIIPFANIKGHDSIIKHQGSAIFPENYATCFDFLKFVSKAVLVILGLGFREIRKIQSKKEKHTWSLQVMNQLLECASMYEYDDNGSIPMQTKKSTKEEETQPYSFIGGSVTFVDNNILKHQTHFQAPTSFKAPSMADKNNEVERKEQGIKEGPTNIVTNYSMADKFFKHFPMTIQDIHGNKNMVLTATRKTTEYNSRLQETPLLIAAKNGVVEMVEKILELLPIAIHDMNVDRKNIVLLAVENRQPHIYKLLLKRNMLRENAFRKVDREGNSALHLAAKLGDHKPWLIPGAALQMQWEIRWYQFVKESMPLNFFPRYNNEGKTPKVIFTETHRDLVKSSAMWLTNTSESCSVVAALIATVAFATSATIPGGNDQDKGTPILKNQPAFSIFAIASPIALCCSVTSVVMFLAILTSRFEEKNYGADLPRMLLVGLSSLFVSIAAMLVSFSAGYFFVLKDEFEYAASLIALCCLPMTLFAIAQLPLYVDLVWTVIKKVPQRCYSVILPS